MSPKSVNPKTPRAKSRKNSASKSTAKCRASVKGRKANSAGLQKEAQTIEEIARTTGLDLLRDKDSLTLPYRESGRKFVADAVWLAPPGSAYKGVCLELQGVGKHTRLGGLRIDHVKGAIAQRSGFLWWASTYAGLAETIPLLIELAEYALLSSEQSA